MTSLALLLGLLVAPASAALRWQDAESWVAQDVVPAIVGQLTEHPRFRGQSIRVVAFENGAPAAESSQLAMQLRDQLSAALLRVPGIQLVAPGAGSGRLDCTRGDIDYYLGLELHRDGRNGIRLLLRTLDVRTNTWVTGHDKRWQGALTASQRRALRERAFDAQFRGQRSAPFADDEIDVLAQRVARDLACASVRQLGGVYTVHIASQDADALEGVGTLIGNNLAGLVAMQFTDNAGNANAVLRATTHAVDGDLAQLWVSLTPLASGSNLPALTANAYVRVATTAVTTTPNRVARNARETTAPPTVDLTPVVATPVTVALQAGSSTTLGEVRLVATRNRSSCDSRRGCSTIEVRGRGTSAVFVLNHQRTHGLVRIGQKRCERNGAPRVLSARGTLSIPVPAMRARSTLAQPARTLELQPRQDVVYALGTSGSRAALAVSRHLRALPQRCSDAARYGLRGAALEQWLGELANLFERFDGDIDLHVLTLAESA